MYKIIKPRGGGKTTEILHLAEENDAIVVCNNPSNLANRAKHEGFNEDMMFVGYKDYLAKPYDYNKNTPLLIDEIDGLLRLLPGDIIGYSLSPED